MAKIQDLAPDAQDRLHFEKGIYPGWIRKSNFNHVSRTGKNGTLLEVVAEREDGATVTCWRWDDKSSQSGSRFPTIMRNLGFDPNEVDDADFTAPGLFTNDGESGRAPEEEGYPCKVELSVEEVDGVNQNRIENILKR